ncbi:unnamed protein product [Linum trigynum]|uniref:Uncharacterized protein n=1 Tax=Linum trigynum TaxID=586398 RepID=A0AAV2F6A9_9ROSI
MRNGKKPRKTSPRNSPQVSGAIVWCSGDGDNPRELLCQGARAIFENNIKPKGRVITRPRVNMSKFPGISSELRDNSQRIATNAPPKGTCRPLRVRIRKLLSNHPSPPRIPSHHEPPPPFK